jgi:2-polyprenyl-3-methyl-5-hydroxy-6-metoxy-1,4-benzoquinol methylase
MNAKDKTSEDSKALWQDVHSHIPKQQITLGAAASAAYLTDPKMIAFIASRYKFVAKVIGAAARVIEIGCGDGFGAPIVAQSVAHLICTDIFEETLADCRSRLSMFRNISFEYADFRAQPYPERAAAAFCVDVIEHIYPSEEASFLDHIAASIDDHGLFMTGTPNVTAEKYASEYSRLGHVNLKDHAGLRKVLDARFHNVIMLSMNDEVVHSGYYPMAHYLWAICSGPRRR